MRKYILLISLFLTSFFVTQAQFLLKKPTTRYTKEPIHEDRLFYERKNGWVAGAQVFSLNMGIWAFDRYVLKGHYAYISWKSIKRNFQDGFYWDNDQIGTNMFMHPYHGSLYYNTARSQGFNYWVSGAYALAGSSRWELFMENEHPSKNDIIATPVGGMVLGEVLFRASDLILDDTKRGGERTRREILAFMVSPMRGLTRLINGDMTRKRPTSGRQFGIPEISAELGLGIRSLELQDAILDRGTGLVLDFGVEYGDRYDHENAKPFDYFTIKGSLNMQEGQPPLGNINVAGRLWAANLVDSKKDFLGIGAYQHFDYYDADTISGISNGIPYKMATPASFGVGLIHNSKRSEKIGFTSYAHLNGVILGSTLSDHYKVANRNYNLGSGINVKAGTSFSYKDKIGASIRYDGYRMYSWKGYPKGTNLAEVDYDELDVQGDKSNTILHIISPQVQVKLKDRMYLTFSGSYFRRKTHYRDFEDVYSQTGEGKMLFTYKF